MPVTTRTEYAEEATSAVADGDFERASELFVRSAGHRIETYLDTSRTDESNLNLVLSDLLAATIYADRTDTRYEAEAIAQFCSGVAPLVVRRSAYAETEGLAHEISGDCFLVIDPERAIEEYERAEAVYETMDHDDRLHWSMEPEFEEAFGRFREYAESLGREVPEEFESGDSIRMDFTGRIRYKMELAGEVVG